MAIKRSIAIEQTVEYVFPKTLSCQLVFENLATLYHNIILECRWICDFLAANRIVVAFQVFGD